MSTLQGDINALVRAHSRWVEGWLLTCPTSGYQERVREAGHGQWVWTGMGRRQFVSETWADMLVRDRLRQGWRVVEQRIRVCKQ